MRNPNHSTNYQGGLLRLGALLVAGALLAACAGPGAAPEAQNTTIYFVRHGEPNFKDSERPLLPEGHARAQRWVAYFKDVPVTHVYATHTDRTRDTVLPLATARGMKVVQFPPVGSELGGKIVVNSTSGSVATKPMVTALRALPPGSTAVVAGNSGNLYPIMAGLGVKSSTACTAERTDCLPCVTRKCFDGKRFDQVWKVVIERDGKVTLSRTSY